MSEKLDQKSRAVLILGIVFVLSLFANFVLMVKVAGTLGEYRIPGGNAEMGEMAFEELKCSACHTVAGVGPFATVPADDALSVPLGGQVTRVKSYGDLITAIIHPSESIRPDIMKVYELSDGKSLMPDYGNAMTTGQLRDLATFLQEHYEVAIPEYPRGYAPYGP